jgi:hypothetical protein
MSGDRGYRLPPKLSKGFKSGTPQSRESRGRAAEAVEVESSGGAAQAQQPASQSATARNQSVHELQAAQASLSALQISKSSLPSVGRSGAAATSSPASAASAAPVRCALPAPSISSSSRTQVAANHPSRPAQPPSRTLQREGTALGAGNLISDADSIFHPPSEMERLPGPRSVPSKTPLLASKITGSRLTQPRGNPLRAAPAAQGGSSPQWTSERQGGPVILSGLRRSRLTDSESSKIPLTDPTSKEKPALPSSRVAAPHIVGGAGPSPSGRLSGGSGRTAAPLSSERLGQLTGVALSTTTTQARQSSAAKSTSTGAATAGTTDAEAVTSEVSHAKPLALHKNPQRS